MPSPSDYIRALAATFGRGLVVRWPDGRVFSNASGKWERRADLEDARMFEDER